MSRKRFYGTASLFLGLMIWTVVYGLNLPHEATDVLIAAGGIFIGIEIATYLPT